VHGCFPPPKIYCGTCLAKNGRDGYILNTTGFTLLLGFLEQQTLYNAYNFNQASSDSMGTNADPDYGPNRVVLGDAAINSTVVGTFVAAFYCPADDKPELVDSTDVVYNLNNARRCNYFFCVSEYFDGFCPTYIMPDPTRQGAFYSDLSISINSIKDGTSTTALIGESRQKNFYSLWGPYWGAGAHTSSHGMALKRQFWPWAPQFLPNTPAGPWLGITSAENPLRLPYAWEFSSRHRGLVHMVFGDGSVHAIKDTINIDVWPALHTIAANEALGSDSY
jgi:hypothetical protein